MLNVTTRWDAPPENFVPDLRPHLPNPFTQPRRRRRLLAPSFRLLASPAVKFSVTILAAGLICGLALAGHLEFAWGAAVGLFVSVLIFA